MRIRIIRKNSNVKRAYYRMRRFYRKRNFNYNRKIKNGYSNYRRKVYFYRKKKLNLNSENLDKDLENYFKKNEEKKDGNTDVQMVDAEKKEEKIENINKA